MCEKTIVVNIQLDMNAISISSKNYIYKNGEKRRKENEKKKEANSTYA